MYQKNVALEYKDYYNPYNENDKPSWKTHRLFHIPKTEFAEFNKANPNNKLNILDISEARFNELVTQLSKLDFTPDVIFSNSGELQGWKNFHIHAIQGERINPEVWSIFDNFKDLDFSKHITINSNSYDYATVSGTRSFQDQRTDLVCVVDISLTVLKNNTIDYKSLKETIPYIISSFQKHPFEMGTLVLVPNAGSFKVYYVLKPNLDTGL